MHLEVLKMINYEIVKASPQQLHLQVKYTKADLPDYWINFSITDFGDENLHLVAQDGAERAKSFWENISDLPSEVSPQYLKGVAKPRVYIDSPDCDRATQNVTFEWVETDDAITQTWTVSEKSDEEKQQVVFKNRAETVVTMRQARLALLSEGLLSSVDSAISGLPDGEREAAEIEWSYGSEVQRLSPLVVTLMPALGMSEEEIDDLFVLAKSL
jgi:hypothetical protein